jgi:cytochrome c biogenesis protein CcdA
MNKLFDLRFVIGSFFTLVGILLLGYSFTAASADNTQVVNRWCGIVFIVFGVLMIVLSLQKDADDELLEE